MSYMGDQVWLITSKHTEPDLSNPSAKPHIVSGVDTLQLIDVWMEYAVHKANTGAFVWVLVG